jgi:hydroxymethylpyrimidine kinase/phosphomethylpyrimidine kinase/thiamine-phosphate diphosphorylase
MNSSSIAWTIAGSDSGAGAGIQADIKTMQGLSVYCCSVITAVTAQNTCGVFGIESMSPSMVQLQFEALSDDLQPNAIKLGMLYSAEIVDTVVQFVDTMPLPIPIIYDPVVLATSSDALMTGAALQVVRSKLLPKTTLITPNWAEAHYLTGRVIADAALFTELELDLYVERLASDLLDLGPRSVLLKGGHIGSKFSQDFWTDGKSRIWLTSLRQNTAGTHGTGCTLSAAITAGVANRLEIVEAMVIAKAYVNQGLRMAPQLGLGNGPLSHLGTTFEEQDLPWLTQTAAQGRLRTRFERDDTIGFYPIVTSSEWVHKLATAGVKTIQLRIKNETGEKLEDEIASAIKIAKALNCNLYINDHWTLALKHGAYGVHLGQEDLSTACIDTIFSAGLKLGISTHCYEEVARALSIQPSYIAIGPIYPTTTKQMHFLPQGKTGLSRWRKLLRYPLVAIGGITLDQAHELLAAGADGIAVVRDIVEHPNVDAHAQKWLSCFSNNGQR